MFGEKNEQYFKRRTKFRVSEREPTSTVPDTVTKTEHFNMTLSPSKTDINFGHRKRAQTFSEGTERIHAFLEYSSIRIIHDFDQVLQKVC